MVPGPKSPGDMPARRRATIQDVADRAAVSIATVSRVLNGVESVDRVLADRVRAAIEALQYLPSKAARALAGHRSTTLGLLVSEIQNPFFMELIRGVEDVAQRNGFLVVLCNSTEDAVREQQYIDVLCAEPVAGVIIVPCSDRKPILRPFVERGIPVVTIDRHVRGHATDSVLIDNVAAAREAVAHLICNGYRRIGLITGPDSASTSRERREGYRLALQDACIPHDPGLERSGWYSGEGARQLAEELLDLRPPIEALFTGNNRLTFGALQALHARGLRMPEDIALVGFDEVPWAHPGSTSLTSVIQPVYEMGCAAATRLIQRLQHPEITAPQQIFLAYHFHIGDSSHSNAHIVTPTTG